MKTKKVYIHTIGCQMNVYDSEQMERRLMSIGYARTSSVETADLIITNTCSIREKAEQKAFSFIGRLLKLKKRKHDLIIGVTGCVAQQEGRKILARMPHVDLVMGPQAIDKITSAVARIETHRCRIVDVADSPEIKAFQQPDVKQEDMEASKFVTIMHGCDNFCTYCVVPFVRGREKSRQPEDILQEIRSLVQKGVKEVTLLGQNVNSYGKKQKLCDFSELIKKINDIEGLMRIRFTTSHPKDLSDDLIDAFGSVEKLCLHIHLPVQSGSDRILKHMNRKYTREDYLQKIENLRNSCPSIAITSDIIVGFPGETHDDFEETCELIRQVAFDGLFAFKYSDRPNTRSRLFSDKVTEEEKRRRLQDVLDLQAGITQRSYSRMIGNVENVLVEGFGKKQEDAYQGPGITTRQWSGRTSCNKIVNFIAADASNHGQVIMVGNMLQVRIEEALAHSLLGRVVKDTSANEALKGEESYAA